MRQLNINPVLNLIKKDLKVRLLFFRSTQRLMSQRKHAKGLGLRGAIIQRSGFSRRSDCTFTNSEQEPL